MVKRITIRRFFLLIGSYVILLLSIGGCATGRDVALDSASLASFPPIQVVRRETDGKMTTPAGFRERGSLMANIMIPATTQSFLMDCKWPGFDFFGQTVTTKFVSNVGEGIPQWPQMVNKNNPLTIKSSDSVPQSSPVLIITPTVWVLSNIPPCDKLISYCNGEVITVTKAELIDISGKVIWRKTHVYETNRERILPWDKFTANQCKLVKEELDFAADKTYRSLIDNLKNGAAPKTK